MTIATKEKIEVYFYNGFSKPKLIASNIEELQDVTLHDNYLGDKTEEFLEDVDENSWDIENLSEALSYYNMLVNPTIEEFVEESLRWFDKNNMPYHHFDGRSRYEIDGIVNRTYDDFKKYYGYENKVIIDSYIRATDCNGVIESFDNAEEARDFMDDNCLWEDSIMLCVDSSGRAYYPQF